MPKARLSHLITGEVVWVRPPSAGSSKGPTSQRRTRPPEAADPEMRQYFLVSSATTCFLLTTQLSWALLGAGLVAGPAHPCHIPYTWWGFCVILMHHAFLLSVCWATTLKRMNGSHIGSRGFAMDWTHTRNNSVAARWPGETTPPPHSSLITGVSAGGRHPETTCRGRQQGRQRGQEQQAVLGHWPRPPHTHTPLIPF